MRCINLCLLLIAVRACHAAETGKEGREYWYEEAAKALRVRLKGVTSTSDLRARNVVLLVGDGLGVATSTAARIFKGQRDGHNGEDAQLAWDKFPAVALTKTYNLDAQVGESSACATALMCGVKANFETLGLDAGGKFEDCFASFSSRVDCLIAWAQQEGKATGIVSNTRVSHATPAALYAYAASRYWEDDAKVPPAARKSCKDITRQLVEDEPGNNINVILGGGRRHWLPKVARDPEQTTEEGRRLDGRNLVDDWLRDKKKRGLRAEYVWNRSQLESVDVSTTDHLLGLFAYSHMDFEADRDTSLTGDPSLVEMTVKALAILSKNHRGFFLCVESGRIDHAHHYNNPYRALEETLLLDRVVYAVLSLVQLSDTLVVVTSDHSHVLTFGGLATPRGNSILGVDTKTSDIDGLPYSTLLYGNGPGYSSPRSVPSNSSEEEKNAVHSSSVPRQWATHGGEDVPVYALGPLARLLFTGTVDQSYIPHAISYVACMGPHRQRCLDDANVTFVPVSTCSEEGGASVTNNRRAGVSPVLASSVMSDNSAANRRHSHMLLFMFYAFYMAIT